ncbi:ENDO-14-BETA-GLUCANASE [Salix viminalis]|uniref:Endoglucanase n=1 Tax=Salix viminalis TaxID=40686 RepID=A0A9Q0T7E0_SALVM|nr:ENDO-14-BETA-GLUCANASE [Salix viminalis]
MLFDFADKYRGKYDSSISVVQKYYRSVSGYNDELLWAAAWLYQATNNQYYLDYLGNNGDSMGGTGWGMTEFGWDVKYAGVQTLVAKFLMQGKAGHHAAVFEKYQQKAEYFMCSCLGKGTRNAQKTPGGLIYRQRWNNMQFVTGASFLASVYSDYLASAGRNLNCAAGNVAPSQLLSFAKSQVDYILGDNPRATSYMVGYGNNYPRQVHHRGSSIVSYKVDPTFVSCRGVVVPGPIEKKPAPLPKVTPAPASTSSPISIAQKMTTTWIANGKTYYRYSITVTNKSAKELKDIKLSISKLYGPLWGLTKSGNSYAFPSWISSLPAGKSLEFVYIHSASAADISVASYTLA